MFLKSSIFNLEKKLRIGILCTVLTQLGIGVELWLCSCGWGCWNGLLDFCRSLLLTSLRRDPLCNHWTSILCGCDVVSCRRAYVISIRGLWYGHRWVSKQMSRYRDVTADGRHSRAVRSHLTCSKFLSCTFNRCQCFSERWTMSNLYCWRQSRIWSCDWFRWDHWVQDGCISSCGAVVWDDICGSRCRLWATLNCFRRGIIYSQHYHFSMKVI